MAIPSATRQLVRQRANELCEYCHANERWQFIRFTMDHVRPVSHGGTDQAENLALACRNCNERRGDLCKAVDPATGDLVVLFDPRTQLWNQHFAWAADRIRLVGMTAVGRATLIALDMNDDRHEGIVLRVRQRDRDDGYHPPGSDLILSD